MGRPLAGIAFVHTGAVPVAGRDGAKWVDDGHRFRAVGTGD
ncbi:hypothetical protein [Nocardia sputorum]|nr:hypothetical protein [Nocardia sputorum]